jgi:hypothetical protein
VPTTITSTANEIKSHVDQPLAVEVRTGATTAGALAISEDELAAAAGEVVSGAGVSAAAAKDELAFTGDLVVSAACFADCFPRLAASRAERGEDAAVGSAGTFTVPAAAGGATAVGAGGIEGAMGATGVTTGATVGAGVTTAGAGGAVGAVGVTTGCAGVVVVATGAGAAAAGVLIWSGVGLASGVCANPGARSRAVTTISKNTLFMESSEEPRLAAVCEIQIWS